MDVVAILRDELHFDAKQVNAIVNLARASGEEEPEGRLALLRARRLRCHVILGPSLIALAAAQVTRRKTTR